MAVRRLREATALFRTHIAIAPLAFGQFWARWSPKWEYHNVYIQTYMYTSTFTHHFTVYTHIRIRCSDYFLLPSNYFIVTQDAKRDFTYWKIVFPLFSWRKISYATRIKIMKTWERHRITASGAASLPNFWWRMIGSRSSSDSLQSLFAFSSIGTWKFMIRERSFWVWLRFGPIS